VAILIVNKGGKAGELRTSQLHPDVTCKNVIGYVKPKGCMWKGKVEDQSNHLGTLVWALFVCAMSGEHHQKTDSKAYHLKSMSECDKPLSMQEILSVAHD
jgi:hypothetical protein